MNEYVNRLKIINVRINLSLDAKILTYQGSTCEYVITIFFLRTFHSQVILLPIDIVVS